MRPKRPLLVAVSLCLHLAIVLGLFIAGFWQLDRLDPPRRNIDIAVAPPPPPASSGSPDAAEPQPFTKKKPKRKPQDIVQPVAVTPDDAITTTPVTTSPPGTGEGTGTGSGHDPEGTGECVGEHCGPPEPAKTPPPPPPPPPPAADEPPRPVAPTVLKAMRTHGETQIHMPDLDKTRLLRAGSSRATATVKVCVGATGSVISLAMARGSGLASWDAAILAAVRKWQHRPHRVDNRAVAVCGMVTFAYEIR